jgi:tRNA-dihydrouridine synthase
LWLSAVVGDERRDWLQHDGKSRQGSCHDQRSQTENWTWQDRFLQDPNPPRPEVLSPYRFLFSSADLSRSETIRFIKIVEAAGVDYITIHGRLRNQRSSTPPNFEAIKILRTQTTLPVLANGDVYTIEDAHRITKETGVDGVMAARGLLENPALFAGFDKTPTDAISQFIHYAVQGGMRHELVVHHLTEMMTKTSTKRERAGLATCNDMVDVVDWLDSREKLQRPLV